MFFQQRVSESNHKSTPLEYRRKIFYHSRSSLQCELDLNKLYNLKYCVSYFVQLTLMQTHPKKLIWSARISKSLPFSASYALFQSVHCIKPWQVELSCIRFRLQFRKAHVCEKKHIIISKTWLCNSKKFHSICSPMAVWTFVYHRKHLQNNLYNCHSWKYHLKFSYLCVSQSYKSLYRYWS